MTDDQNADFRIARFKKDVIREFLQIRPSIAGGIEMMSRRELANSLNRRFQFDPESVMNMSRHFRILLGDGLDVVLGFRMEV